ncbi:MAG: hypothetical protein ACRECP_09215 [Methylocella sp.]
MRRQPFVRAANPVIPAVINGVATFRLRATFRKITNGFRTERSATLHAGIRAIIETARRRSPGARETIRLAIAGKQLATVP